MSPASLRWLAASLLILAALGTVWSSAARAARREESKTRLQMPWVTIDPARLTDPGFEVRHHLSGVWGRLEGLEPVEVSAPADEVPTVWRHATAGTVRLSLGPLPQGGRLRYIFTNLCGGQRVEIAGGGEPRVLEDLNAGRVVRGEVRLPPAREGGSITFQFAKAVNPPGDSRFIYATFHQLTLEFP